MKQVLSDKTRYSRAEDRFLNLFNRTCMHFCLWCPKVLLCVRFLSCYTSSLCLCLSYCSKSWRSFCT